ncbi:MAG: rhomboid family intramembrane serine protease [Cyanobacteria bacterium SZAS LIN-3]|nr:rhomboid family intramembrane serine protease [Cyanobacteria bacterium SZAS LIN-3]
MLPIRDTYPSASPPVMTWTIMVINCLVFYVVNFSPLPQREMIVHLFGFIPAQFIGARGFWPVLAESISIVSSLFLHASWAHLIGNLWFMAIFADNVEDVMGHWKFLLFYLLMGALGCGTLLVFDPGSHIPTIGASGAIAGVLGAYGVLFPESRIITLVPIIIIPWLIEISAWFYLGVWFLVQVIGCIHPYVIGGVNGGVEAASVAWGAHIGGFLAGALLARVFAWGAQKPATHLDQYHPW